MDLDNYKGGDGAYLKEDMLDMELEKERNLCSQAIRRTVAAHPNILTQADVNAYETSVFSDHALAVSGYTKLEDKIQALREMRTRWIPMLSAQAPILENKFRRQIEEAIGKKWIGRKSVARWMQRLSADNAFYMQKKEFIENPEKFPKYLKQWQEVAEKREKLMKDPQFKLLRGKDVTKLGVFKNDEEFLNKSYEERKNLLSIIDAALRAKSREMPQLYKEAKSQLEGAARNKAMSWNKIGPWLEKIFSSNAKPELIDDFLSGRGNMPLSKLIANWTQASKRFQSLDDKRKTKGTPRGMHFVKMEVFLNWHFERRKAYLDHAEESIEEIGNEKEVILKIRHELGSQDWESAESLIAEARREPMTEAQNKRLNSMEKYLREHRSKLTEKEQKEKERSPDEIMKEIESLLGGIPPQLQKFYRKSLNRGYQSFWAWTTLMYNRVWCHQHNYLDENKEKTMEKSSKEKTRQRIKDGHSDYGLEANVVKDDTNAEAAIRDQDGTKGAQILFVEEDAHESLVEKVNEQKNNRNFWYWTSVIPEGVKYPEHLYIVQAIHPKLKKLARELEATGSRFPLSGAFAPPSTSTTTAKKAGSSKPPVPEMSMSA